MKNLRETVDTDIRREFIIGESEETRYKAVEENGEVEIYEK